MPENVGRTSDSSMAIYCLAAQKSETHICVVSFLDVDVAGALGLGWWGLCKVSPTRMFQELPENPGQLFDKWDCAAFLAETQKETICFRHFVDVDVAGVFEVGGCGLWDVSPTHQNLSEDIGQVLDSSMPMYCLVGQNSKTSIYICFSFFRRGCGCSWGGVCGAAV